MVGTNSGWYPDPMGPPGQRRFWDGQEWTAQTAAAKSSGSGKTAMIVVGAVAGAFVLLCGVLGAIGLAVDSSDTGKDTGAAADAADLDATEPDDLEESTDGEESAEPAPVVEASEPTTEATIEPEIETFLVSYVVDGDTIELDNGETVRLVGIDTPETGECGHQRAADALSRLILDKQVRLVESDEDRDKYDRLLRYIDVGKVDAGLQLIKKGLAIARYDSRDGYGRHPREGRYIAADENAPDVKCQPKPKPQPFADPGQGAGCEPGYSPCVPLYPPDLDCADTGPVTVTGSDPHGLDRDNDGVACGGD